MGNQQPPHLTLHTHDPFLATVSGSDWVRGAAWIIEQLAERRPAVPRSELLAAAMLVRKAEADGGAGNPELRAALDRLCATLASPRHGRPTRR